MTQQPNAKNSTTAPVSPNDSITAPGVDPHLLQQRARRVSSGQLTMSYIIPVLNEESLLADFLQKLDTAAAEMSDCYEIIIIDDGSCDQTLLIANQALQEANGRGQTISLSRHFGKEAAIAAGLQAARGEVAIIIDADFQHPFATLQQFLQQWQLGFDNVYGVKAQLKSEALIWRIGRHLFHAFIDKKSRVAIPRGAGDFRLLDRKAIDALNQCTEQDKFMKGLYAFVGFRSKAVLYTPGKRHSGQSHYHFWRLTRFAASGFLAFSSLPLRIWSVIGLLIASCSFLTALYIIADTLIYGADIPGYATLLVALVFFGGMQLLSIGILGEYIARIFREVKPRPAFIIQQQQTWGEDFAPTPADMMT